MAAHGYAEQLWETPLRWWLAEHEILMAETDRIPEERLEASCVVGEEAPVTLRFLIEDYVAHQEGHLSSFRQPDSHPRTARRERIKALVSRAFGF